MKTLSPLLCFTVLLGLSNPTFAQDVLPFPITPSASEAGRTIGESTNKRRQDARYLSEEAPNILIILIDDAGPGLPDTFGGEVHTPTLSRIANTGISYNRFHSTAMCSPTRASLLTGRNHTRVGNGQIAELSNDWDGFSGVIPKTSATVAEVLKNYGYNTSAFGKWHNTPTMQTTAAGPFDYWPTGYGFEYFYGFLAGEASQYEPTMVRNTTYVPLPKTPEEGYHLTEDIADDAIKWIHQHQAFSPDKPFFMYWAPGAVHGPHHVPKVWADKYKGKFDDGWDNYRERVFKRQKEMGWIPANTQLTPRPETLASWESIPEAEKPFQRRLMEVYAGFAEHADHHAGRIVEELERMGLRDDTLIFYIWGDNGSSSEGMHGSISELLAQNQIPTEISQHIEALDGLGGLEALGTPKTDNMYHAGWAWAGSTPYKGTKLVAAHFGGTRQPMAVSWPKKVDADKTPRAQFHHVNDVVPTIYQILEIKEPQVVNGFPQDVIDGTSMAYTFDDANAKGQKSTQFFDVMASRSIYHEGWIASAFGPRTPWLPVTPGMATWTPDKDVWELYNLDEDFSQSKDLASEHPEKLAAMKELFLIESAKNKNLPIGGGLWVMYHPEDAPRNMANEFHFTGDIDRMPEFTAPKIGIFPHHASMEVDIPDGANGVLFALGGFSAGVTCYIKDNQLHYEYNLFEIERTKVASTTKLKGPTKLEFDLQAKPHQGGGPPHLHSGEMVIKANGKEIARTMIPTLATLAFTANDCFDIGSDLGSPVSDDYYEQAPFKFNGTIKNMDIVYQKP
ncbi:arylsulfatase [Algoriphagus aestuariicola]|uniref:arylsulfatase n=1 Tax=Algoriphagus aestuariicola TaxID=1852016 RepID=UPI001F493C70|nr:arylsulfatase [Algoriphagus aestuariicola]